MKDAVPALIFCDPNIGSLRIAALTLLDRLVVAIHRAGCAPITIVCDGELPALQRSLALGIAVDVERQAPSITTPTLVADCRMIVQAGDVAKVIAAQGRLMNARGETLPLGLVTELKFPLEQVITALPVISAAGVAEPVIDAASARKAGDALWAALGNSSDGFVDQYFNRPLSRYLSKLLVHTPATPNQVTIAATIIGLAGAYGFSLGTHATGIWGALLLQLSALVDCVDGELARMSFKESPLGKWLDLGMDQVVHVAVFAAIAVGLSRQGADAPVLLLGASAVAGVIISFPVVVRGQILANKTGNSRLGQFIDKATTRDFTALLVLLAFFDRLPWFLWLTAIMVHVFWVTALALQFPRRRTASVSANQRR